MATEIRAYFMLHYPVRKRSVTSNSIIWPRGELNEDVCVSQVSRPMAHRYNIVVATFKNTVDSIPSRFEWSK